MSTKCVICDKNVSLATKGKIHCNDCDGIFHGDCLNLTQEDIDHLIGEKAIWRCGDCQTIRRKSLCVDTSSKMAGSEEILSYLREMREESKTQMEKLESDLGKSVEGCHEQIAELLKITEEQSKLLREYDKKFEVLRQENVNLKEKVKSQEEKIDELEQYSRVNCVEINGIPESKNEDVLNIVKSVGTALEINVSDGDVDACHRLGTKQEGRIRGIIVKFVRRATKEEFLRKRKIKRNLNTSDIGSTNYPADVVYINESLSPVRRKVLAAARSVKRDHGYKFVWVKNGKIFLRKNEGDKVIVLTNLEQVAMLNGK
ncbi:uncharacterized protein LOC116167585 [Photinus pyralis]|nr:uncharacterized protein LOC116167585 [Photinus pyralis]